MHADAIAHNYAQLCNWEEIQILQRSKKKIAREWDLGGGAGATRCLYSDSRTDIID